MCNETDVFGHSRQYRKPNRKTFSAQRTESWVLQNVDIIIDCGEDWSNQVMEWQVDAIFVTHAHPDHAFGLKEGALCTVYATEDALQTMESFDITDRVTLPERDRISFPEGEQKQMVIEAFPVLHSTRAPAVGIRVEAGGASIFYSPDVAWIGDRESAMKGADVYIGDGATIKQSMVRKPGDTIIGHAPIQTQLTWCQKTGVKKAMFTHLGSEIVNGNLEDIRKELNSMAKERDVEQATIVNDGMSLVLR